MRDADDVWRRRSKPWDARPSCRAFLYPLILIPFGIDPRRYTGGHASPFVMVDRATLTIAAKPARTKRPDSWFRPENRDKYSCFHAENRAVWPLAGAHSGARTAVTTDLQQEKHRSVRNRAFTWKTADAHRPARKAKRHGSRKDPKIQRCRRHRGAWPPATSRQSRGADMAGFVPLASRRLEAKV